MPHFRRFPGLSFQWDPREPVPPFFLQKEKNFPQPSALDLQVHNVNAYHVQHEDVWNWDNVAVPAGPRPAPEISSAKIQNVLLPPSSTELSAHIIQDTATITIAHSFENKSAAHLKQGSYQFPLPHTAAVVDFTCRIGDSPVLRGTVKPKEAAKRAFHDAVRRRRPAGLLEQDNSPEIFRMSIGNIPAGARATTELTIILLLKHDFLPTKSVTQTTLAIPTYIAPRYGTAPTGILETGPRGPETTLSVQIDILSAEEIINIRSDTHPIDTELGAARRKCQRWADLLAPQPESKDPSTSAHVQLSSPGITHLVKDLTITITTRPDSGLETPVAALESHPFLPHHAALMVTLPPKFMLQRTSPSQSSTPDSESEIIFVADRSGSMGDKIAPLKSALDFFIRSIPSGRPFNIWCFGTSHTSLWTKSRALAQDTMTEALQYVETRFNADMGGTELLPALRTVMASRDGTRGMQVVVLTDGEVWELEKTISFVEESSRGEEGGGGGKRPVRYFGLGIGDAVSRALVEGIAEAGGGYAEIIPNATEGGWEERLVAVLEAALAGYCGRVEVEVDGAVKGSPMVLTSPKNVSAVSPFVRSRIFYLFEGVMAESCKNVTLKTTDASGNEIRTVLPVRLLRDKDIKLHRFAVRAVLGDLERRLHEIRNPERSGYYYARTASSQEILSLKREGERLGCKWSLASKWTSFVALEEQEGEAAGKDGETFKTETDDLGLLRPRNAEKQRLLLASASLGLAGALAGYTAPPTITPADSSSVEPSSDRGGDQDTSRSESDEEYEGDFSYLNAPQALTPQRFWTGPAPMSRGSNPSAAGVGLTEHPTRFRQMIVSVTSRSIGSPKAITSVHQTSAVETDNTMQRPPFRSADVRNFEDYNESVINDEVPIEPTTEKKKKNRLSAIFQKLSGRLSPFGKKSSTPKDGSKLKIDVEPTTSTTGTTGSAPATSSARDNTTSSTPSAPNKLPKPEAKSAEQSDTSIKAPAPEKQVPVFNPPAANPDTAPPPPKQSTLDPPAPATSIIPPTAARAFIKKIIQYQHSNGAFIFPGNSEIRTVLGLEFYTSLKTKIPSNTPEIIGVTALVVALLEAQFDSCRGLWVLVVEKAKGFVASKSKVAGLDVEGVWTNARAVVAGMSTLELEEDGRVRVKRDSAEGVELLFAPVV